MFCCVVEISKMWCAYIGVWGEEIKACWERKSRKVENRRLDIWVTFKIVENDWSIKSTFTTS